MAKLGAEIAKRFQSFLPRQSLSFGKMREMRKSVDAIAKELNIVTGVFYVTGRRGLVRLSKKVGEDVPPELKDVARDKLRTARRRHRSTLLVGEALRGQQLQPQDYGKHVPTIVPGGVAIFDNGKFIGAVAFAGGHALKQDHELARRVVEKAGYSTDLPKPKK